MILLLLACGGGDPKATSATPVLSASWVADIAAHPEGFSAVVNPDRAGWTALHRNDWPTAWSAGPVAHARAGEELARFHRILHQLQGEAWEGILDTWGHRGGLPAATAIGVFAQLAGAHTLGPLGAVAPPPAFGTPQGVLRDWILARTDAEVWGLEKQVRGGDLAAVDTLRARAATPAWREPIEGGERRLYDPLIHDTLATAYGAGGAVAPADARLFSGLLGAGTTSPAESLAAMGITLPTTDDADACRAVVAALDAQLDPWAATLGAAGSEGAALLDELRLVDGLRSRALTTLAVAAVDNAKNACAAVYAQDSLDAASARSVGPINHPTAYAVLALADLRTGRAREALDALQPLMEPFPETNGVREVTGDLAVLLGMDRIGDSREN